MDNFAAKLLCVVAVLLCKTRIFVPGAARRHLSAISSCIFPSARSSAARSSAIATSTLASRPNSDYIQSDAEGVPMKLTNRVKSISKLKAQAADVIDDVTKSKTPVVITVNGEAKAVLQDVASYEETQEALALLKILALANKDIVAGKVRPMKAAFAQVRRRTRA
jgi:prevent-host-death family protein